jgi:hypothetical protein
MKKTIAAIAATAAFALSAAIPTIAGAQAPTAASPCPSGGAQPVTTQFVDSVRLFNTTPFVQSGFGFVNGGFLNNGFINPFFNASFAVSDVVTQTENVAGVQGLTQTVASNGFGAASVSLGVPDYLFQAYGGNITAIQRDLAAGYLKCRTR